MKSSAFTHCDFYNTSAAAFIGFSRRSQQDSAACRLIIAYRHAITFQHLSNTHDVLLLFFDNDYHYHLFFKQYII